jgi:hypothetical protein
MSRQGRSVSSLTDEAVVCSMPPPSAIRHIADAEHSLFQCRQWPDEHTIADLNRFAVGNACVVQKARAVVAAAVVDHESARQHKNKPMSDSGLLASSRPTAAGDFTFAFDESLASGEGTQREQPLAVH